MKIDTNALIMAQILGGDGSSVTVEPLPVTANGTYTAPTGKAYSPVTVNVAKPDYLISDGDLVSTFYFNTAYALGTWLATLTYSDLDPDTGLYVCYTGLGYFFGVDLTSGQYALVWNDGVNIVPIYSTVAVPSFGVTEAGWQMASYTPSVATTVVEEQIIPALWEVIDDVVAKDDIAFGIELPKLNAPSISISTKTLSITNPSTNGNFATGYNVYLDGVFKDTTSSQNYDLGSLTGTINGDITATVKGNGFANSASSNAVHYQSFLSAPIITLTNGVVTWSTIANATGYNVYSDGTLLTTVSTTSVNLETEISIPGTYSIQVSATSTAFGESEKSNSVSFTKSSVSRILDENTWATISSVSAAGEAANYWSVGDKKAVSLLGTIGNSDLGSVALGYGQNPVVLYVYILDFNHNTTVEGEGISFGGFKKADGTDCAIKTSNTSHFKLFNDRTTTYFAGANGLYKNVIGGDKKVNPTADTLMAILPEDMRSVLKSHTKKYGIGAATSPSSVAGFIFPFFAREIDGSYSSVPQPDKDYQTQYQYYQNGASKVRYGHNSTSALNYWTASRYYLNGRTYVEYVYVSNNGSLYGTYADGGSSSSYFGLAVTFKV